MLPLKKILLDARLPRFLVVGSACFLTNLLVLFICTEKIGMHYLASMIVSIVIANSLGWAANRAWTFEPTQEKWHSEYRKYFIVNLGSFGLSLISMAILVSGLGVHYLLASTFNAIGLTVLNFALHRDWSFKKKN